MAGKVARVRAARPAKNPPKRKGAAPIMRRPCPSSFPKYSCDRAAGATSHAWEALAFFSVLPWFAIQSIAASSTPEITKTRWITTIQRI